MIQEQAPELKRFRVRGVFTRSGEDIHAIKRRTDERVQREFHGHIRDPHPLNFRVSTLTAPWTHPPTGWMSIENGAALRMDQMVRFEIRESRFGRFIVPCARVKQQLNDVSTFTGSPSHSEIPAMSETATRVALVIVLGRFEIPGQ